MAGEIKKDGEPVKTSGQDRQEQLKKREAVEYMIDTDPDLDVLRRVLNDPIFVEASRINKDRIIDSYMSYDSDLSNPIDTHYILMNTIYIIKQVSETPNGLVYNLDGTLNKKLSREQRLEYNLEENAILKQAEKDINSELYKWIKDGNMNEKISKSIFVTEGPLSDKEKQEAVADLRY